MFTRTRLFIGAIVLAVIAVLVVGFVVHGDMTTRIIALLGFLFAAAKIAYDVYDQERERQNKAEENREKVKVIPKYARWDHTTPVLGVVIYNDGSTPVHIRSVVFHFRVGGEEKTTWLSDYESQPGGLLERKDKAKYRDAGEMIDGNIQVDYEPLLALPESDVWIVVTSYQGEIARVTGDEILRVLKSPPTHQGQD